MLVYDYSIVLTVTIYLKTTNCRNVELSTNVKICGIKNTDDTMIPDTFDTKGKRPLIFRQEAIIRVTEACYQRIRGS